MLPYDPIAERAGLHPNWRTLHLNHLRQARAFFKADRYSPDRKEILKRGQQSLARARRRREIARDGIRHMGRRFSEVWIRTDWDANTLMRERPNLGVIDVRDGFVLIVDTADMGEPA